MIDNILLKKNDFLFIIFNFFVLIIINAFILNAFNTIQNKYFYLIEKVKQNLEEINLQNLEISKENQIFKNNPKEIIKDDGTIEYYSLSNNGNIIKRKKTMEL